MSVLEVEEEAPIPAPDPVPTAEPEAPVEPEPEVSPADVVRAELEAFQEHMILARRLVLETQGVRTGSLCSSGVANFMIRVHLSPYRGMSKDRHPNEEPPDNVPKAEATIRKWCATSLGVDIEDLSDVGLAKRLPVLQKTHADWLSGFREHCINNRSYIPVARMAEVFPQLGIALYEPTHRVTIQVSYDYAVPASRVGGNARTFQLRERERLLEALRGLAGPDATSEGCQYTDPQRCVILNVTPQ